MNGNEWQDNLQFYGSLNSILVILSRRKDDYERLCSAEPHSLVERSSVEQVKRFCVQQGFGSLERLFKYLSTHLMYVMITGSFHKFHMK